MNIQRHPKTKWEERSMGFIILGWSFVVIGVIVAIWGFMEYPASAWLSTELLAFAIGGASFIAAGLAILKTPGWLIAIAILIAALLLIIFIWKSNMDLPSALLSSVVVAALTTWLVHLSLK